jgi:fructose-specific phosphotransferase system IIC component
MRHNIVHRYLSYSLVPIYGLLTGCARNPSFDIVGSLFPAWLVCLVAGILLTVPARWLLSRLQVSIVYPILVFPSLTALFTFVLWLVFFS